MRGFLTPLRAECSRQCPSGNKTESQANDDTLAEDAVFEYVISVPGYPRRVAGREAVAELTTATGKRSFCAASTNWPFTETATPQSWVLEYAVHGRAVSTGHAYHNHFVSVITVKDRKGHTRA